MLFRGKNAADLEDWKMTKEQINIAIAESQGWSIFHRNDKGEIKSWKHPDGSIWQEPWVPLRFTEDLNAMHEVIKTLDTKQQIQYADVLCRQTGKELLDYTGCYYPGENPIIDMEIIFLVHNSTALQRAEAYLRTIGKWNEKD